MTATELLAEIRQREQATADQLNALRTDYLRLFAGVFQAHLDRLILTPPPPFRMAARDLPPELRAGRDPHPELEEDEDDVDPV